MLRRSFVLLIDKKSRPVMAKVRPRAHAKAAGAGEVLYNGTDEADGHDDDVNINSGGGGLSAATRSAVDHILDADNNNVDDHHALGTDDAGAAYHPDGAQPPHDDNAAENSNAPKSTEAYRFLLDHIDAEIASLQRRHAAVTTRRQKIEVRQTNRIKELFEFMESPWLLVKADVQPPLPATGVDVYIKEQRVKHHKGDQGSSKQSPADAKDKMFVLACHKNYRNLHAAQKKCYEEAAAYNAAVRQELKYRLATGCSRFEAFCAQVVECSAEMAREGRVPELPSAAAHHSPRYAAQRHRSQAQLAQQRHAAASKAVVEVEEEDDEDEEAPQPVARRKKKAPPTRIVTPPRAAVVIKRAAAAKKSPPAKGKKAAAKGSKKLSVPSPRVSSSIPLPDLNQLAIRKLRKVAGGPAAAKKHSAAKSKVKASKLKLKPKPRPKVSKSKPASGKKKKR